MVAVIESLICPPAEYLYTAVLHFEFIGAIQQGRIVELAFVSGQISGIRDAVSFLDLYKVILRI